jgi:radical SAM/Cys-rich protein
MHATLKLLRETDFPAISRRKVETLQVNLGYRCNQACFHCHVNASPDRKEMMGRSTVDAILAAIGPSGASTLDITGGAPELNPHFRHLVHTARALGVRVIDRCNLTVLNEPGFEDLAVFLATERVEIVASLPCYEHDNVDRQRGDGVFDASILALNKLNALGYGLDGTGLALDLVYNPQGPVLPPAQQGLEAVYKRELGTRFGIAFNRLYTLANMPINRFGSVLVSQGCFASYMALLHSAHQDTNLDGVMCRSLVSVDWRGYLYDCDFNQMLGIPLVVAGKRRRHVSELAQMPLAGLPIAVADHCYGCTAGQGSSCGGALA